MKTTLEILDAIEFHAAQIDNSTDTKLITVPKLTAALRRAIVTLEANIEDTKDELYSKRCNTALRELEQILKGDVSE